MQESGIDTSDADEEDCLEKAILLANDSGDFSELAVLLQKHLLCLEHINLAEGVIRERLLARVFSEVSLLWGDSGPSVEQLWNWLDNSEGLQPCLLHWMIDYCKVELIEQVLHVLHQAGRTYSNNDNFFLADVLQVTNEETASNVTPLIYLLQKMQVAKGADEVKGLIEMGRAFLKYGHVSVTVKSLMRLNSLLQAKTQDDQACSMIVDFATDMLDVYKLTPEHLVVLNECLSMLASSDDVSKLTPEQLRVLIEFLSRLAASTDVSKLAPEHRRALNKYLSMILSDLCKNAKQQCPEEVDRLLSKPAISKFFDQSPQCQAVMAGAYLEWAAPENTYAINAVRLFKSIAKGSVGDNEAWQQCLGRLLAGAIDAERDYAVKKLPTGMFGGVFSTVTVPIELRLFYCLTIDDSSKVLELISSNELSYSRFPEYCLNIAADASKHAFMASLKTSMTSHREYTSLASKLPNQVNGEMKIKPPT